MIHILVVDDDVDVASSTAELLGQLGYRISLAHDGTQALGSIAAERPDLVISDISMPRLDGLGLARAVRCTDAQIPLIAWTANCRPQDKKDAIAAGFDVHLCKLGSFDDVEFEIAKLLARASAAGSQ